ncbi:MAG: hypothetical protein DIU78_019545 [Pseudomonadota bacterium]
MNDHELQRAWVKQAQLDAERGLIECRLCKRRGDLDATTTLWRDGVLVFALCDRCSGEHDVVLSPTERGIKVRARRREPLILRGDR